MSILNLDEMSPESLIAQYIIETRQHGQFLAYTDYQIISDWLKLAKDTDQLLMVLADVLPKFFNQDPHESQQHQDIALGLDSKKPAPRTLKKLHKKVAKTLFQINMLK